MSQMHYLLNEDKHIYTPKEVSIVLDVSADTVRAWCRCRIFGNSFKIGKGRDWRIPKCDVVKMTKPVKGEQNVKEG